jgi:hypothetical protein
VTIPYSQDELFPDAATPLVADESSTERRRRIILHTAVGVGDLAGIEGKEIAEIPRRRRWRFSPPTTTDGGLLSPGPRRPDRYREPVFESNDPGTVGTGVFGGDYDMALIILVRIAIEYQRYLSSEARSILRGKLLTQLGPYDDGQLTWGSNYQETENHILMIEVSRYLTITLFGFDNTRMAKFLTEQMLDQPGQRLPRKRQGAPPRSGGESRQGYRRSLPSRAASSADSARVSVT